MIYCKSCANKDAIIAQLTSDLEAPLLKYHRARPASEWTEEDGNVLWWTFPINEPPYVGTPNDSDYPRLLRIHNNYVFFTPLMIPTESA